MLYFKHSDLVKKYKISLKTVHNWIDASKQGKLSLKLHETSRGTYIANTPGNTAALAHLVEQRKKYRNTRHHKVVTPKPEFYKLYTRRQILDIISNLNIHREIPRQYNYMDGGAENWDKYAQRMWKEDGSNLLKSSVSLLHANLGNIDSLIGKNSKVNVIDVGVGNALPVKELLAHLLERGLLHRYIAIDISESMLHIAKRNIEQWFGDSVKFEGYVRDVSFERFDDLLVDDMLSDNADETINLALILGATPINLRTPGDMLRTIYASLGHEDLVIHTIKPDFEEDRRYFDFNSGPKIESLSPNHSFILDLLNIDNSLYDAEMGYDEQNRMRYIQARLKTSLSIQFMFSNKAKRSVYLEKGDTILLWRAWHLSATEIISNFEKVGFALLQSSMTKDRQYLLIISGINNKANQVP